MIRRASMTALIAATLFAPRLASADTTSEKRAVELYQKSEQLYRNGEFQRAAELLRQAYELDPNPDLLYNLARALEGLGDFAGAANAYARYLDNAKDVADRKSIEARIATLRKQSQPTPPAPAPALPASAAPAKPAPPRAESGSSVLTGPLPWLIAGAGVVTLAAGAVLRASASSQHHDADNTVGQKSAESKQQKAEGTATASNVCFVVGGSLALTGTGLVVVGLATRPAESGWFVSASGRF